MSFDDVVHCSAACGRYTSLAAQTGKRDEERWTVDLDQTAGDRTAYICPDCRRARLKARVRAAMQNGVRLDVRGMSEVQRQAAGEVLGEDLLAAVDRGWGGGRP